MQSDRDKRIEYELRICRDEHEHALTDAKAAMVSAVDYSARMAAKVRAEQIASRLVQIDYALAPAVVELEAV